MGRIWTEENQFQKWLDVEILATEALGRLGVVPKAAAARIRKKARFDVDRIRKIETEVKHETIAFLSSVAEHVGDDARYIHVGMTSSDVMDTAFALQLKEASSILIEDVRELIKALRHQALKYKNVPMIGRTHGVHAEPITFGLKLALWHEEMKRNLGRLQNAAAEVGVGKISGAVGTFAQISPKVEAYVCRKSGLKPAPVSNQIIQRDRHAFFFATLAVIASSLEKFAVEIRHLQRTEVQEAEEPFTAGQKGSSAMPHKRNPILSENITGLARLMRSYAQAALENVALWHERDISHSSVERVILPDSTILVDYLLAKMTGIVERMRVFPERMLRNLDATHGVIFSGPLLRDLIEAGATREDAYKLVQEHAMAAWETETGLRERAAADPRITKFLDSAALERTFDLSRQLRQVDAIFARVFRGSAE
jgi:adenylosuccinate lyase